MSEPAPQATPEAGDPSHLDPEVWDRIASRPEFAELLSAKKRFVIPASLFFLVYYFALIAVVGWFPELAKKRVGPANFAYWFAFSQFFMAWALAWIYVRAAGRFDRLADQLLADTLSAKTEK